MNADPKVIQEIEINEQLKNLDNNGNSTDASNDQSMFVLIILEKTKGRRLIFFQGSVMVLQKMVNYEEARVKLTNIQLSKLKSSAKNKTGATLRITKKNFQYEELPHELFLTTRQKTKIRNTFASSMSTDIKTW